MMRRNFARIVAATLIAGAIVACDSRPHHDARAQLTASTGTKADALRAQLLSNMQVALAQSPRLEDRSAWMQDTDQFGPGAKTLIVLVQVNSDLLDTVIVDWKARNPAFPQGRISDARSRLRKQFERDGQLCFLLLVKPPISDYPHDAENCAVQLGSLGDNLRLETFDGRQAAPSQVESTPTDRLRADGPIASSLFWVPNIVNADTEPRYRIVLANIHFWHRRGNVRYSAPWIRTSDVGAQQVAFAFETSEVHILAMIENGVPWKEICSTYIDPKFRQLETLSGGEGAQMVFQAALDLIVQLLLKGI